MMSFSFEIGPKYKYKRGRHILIMLETTNYVYGFSNFNIFKDFYTQREKCPEWLEEVYSVLRIGQSMIWKGIK